jgi:photosystem II stability/assembly factor-like uncharacterized protein
MGRCDVLNFLVLFLAFLPLTLIICNVRRYKWYLVLAVLLGLFFIGAATKVNLVTQVTGVLPTANGGTNVTDLTFSGNTHVVATSTGSLTSGHCVKLDANGNYIDAGAVCGTSTLNWVVEQPSVVCPTTTVTLAHAPTILLLNQNGVELRSGGGNDYTLSSATVTLNTSCTSGDTFEALEGY